MYNLKKVSTGKARASMFIVVCETGNEEEQLTIKSEGL
jgi:hypothetical protein